MTAQLHDLFQSPQTATQSRFAEGWALWPRKEKKPLAMAKWSAIIRGPAYVTKTLDRDSGQFVEIELQATEQEIIDGIKSYLQSQRLPGLGNYGYKDDGKFIPYLCSWLNQGSWMR